jgi:hypothetical protein
MIWHGHRACLRAVLAGVALLVAMGIAMDAEARTEPLEVTVAETRFIVDAPEGMARFAAQAADVIVEHWEPIAVAAGAPAGREVRVSVEHEIADWFTRRNEPARNPEWAAGLALLGRDTILVKTANPEWRATLRHELAHVAVDLADGDQRAPVWFHEGFAVASAEQWSLERAGTMIRAGLSGNFYAFSELERGFPPASSSAGLAYAQSFHFVRFVREAYGEHVFRDVLARLRDDGDAWDAAFEAETGVALATVFTDWETAIQTRYKWAPATLGGGGGWGLAALIGIAAWRRKKRVAAERLAALQASEASTYGRDPDDETFG